MASLKDNLLHYYKFEGNSTDELGTWTGTDTSISYSSSNGKIVQGAGFTGASKISIPSTSTVYSAFSISVWIKATAPTDPDGKIIDMGGGGGDRVLLGLAPSTGEFQFSTKGTAIYSYSGYLGVWTHLVAVYDGTNTILYINGVEKVRNTTSGSGNVTTGTSSHIGQEYDDGVARHYLGAMDEFGFWNVALTSDQVTTLYASGNGSTYPFSPLVTTQAVTSISLNSAVGNGNVTSDSGSLVTERGIVWSTTANPTTSNFKSTATGTTGAFTASMTNLTSGQLYYVKAYAINAEGTAYGEQVTFTTDTISDDTVIKDINGVAGEVYATQLYVGGTNGSVTVSFGSTGTSQVIGAGAGTTIFQGTYGGLNGLTIVADSLFDGYIDNVSYVLILGTATIDWTLDTLTNVYPINSSVTFKRISDKEFNRFRIMRYLDVQFKDLNAYVTVLLKKESNQTLSTDTKEFLVSNTTGEVLPFINKRISTLIKNQALRIGFSNNKLDETFTICQFIVKGVEQPNKLFDKSKIISIG